MDFQRVLQQSQSYFENPAKQSDATKSILEQGENFQKTMAGERGIMAAIESAHLRPKMQKFIQSKLNGLSSDDVLKGVRNIGTRLNGESSINNGRPTSDLPGMRTPGVGGTVSEGPRGQIRGPSEAPLQESSKVLKGRPNDSGLIEEGGQFRLAPGRSIADRFGPDFEPSAASSRLTRNLDATNNPLNPRNVANVGQSEIAPELDTPENLPGLKGPAAVSREALAEADSGEVTSTRAASALIGAKPVQTIKVLPTAEDLAEGPSVEPELARASPKVSSEPAQAGIGTSAPATVEESIGKIGSVGNPYVGSQAPGPPPPRAAPEDFPSPPSSEPPTTEQQAPEQQAPEQQAPEQQAPPPPARGETDEELAQRLSKVKEIGTGEEETESALSNIGSSIAGSFGKALGFAGDIGEGAGVISALTSKGLSGNQRLGQISQTLAPKVAGKISSTVEDQFGLPKGGSQVASDTENLIKEQADKQLAEKLAEQGGKEAAIGSEEAAVPGVGDILAIGTALYGAIRSGIEAEKSKKEVQAYKPPATPQVAMDNAPTFDSSFR